MNESLAFITANYIETAMVTVVVITMTILAYPAYRFRKIPNRVVTSSIAIWLMLMAIALFTDRELAVKLMQKGIVGALIAGGAFLIVYIIVRGRLGAGDVKMAAVMGLYLGSDRIATALIAGVVISAVYSIIMILAKKLTVKDGLPMAPFLFLGTIIALLYTIV